MALKQEMKLSEARILMFLKSADERYKYKASMSQKLGIDYVYLSNIIKQMEQKKWIKKEKSMYGKAFYFLTGKANLATAANLIVGEQDRLKATQKTLGVF